MDRVWEIIKNSGVSDIFLFACVSFWIAKFVLGQDWKGVEVNGLRTAIGWTFYIFGTLLLVVTLATLPQCSGMHNKNTPQQDGVVRPSAKPDDKPVTQESK